MIIVFYALKRCLDFAEKNPHAAIMDGAEFLVHERIVHGIKGQGELPSSEPTTYDELPQIAEAELIFRRYSTYTCLRKQHRWQ